MAFRDFTFPAVAGRFGLTLAEADLYSATPPAEVSPEFAGRIASGVLLASGIETEKAKSEFIIAPLLHELWLRHRGEFALFSGVPLDVDADRGLNGVCDFLLSRNPLQAVPTAPLMALVEAKNDNPRHGFGQCIASMVAVREFNDRAGERVPVVHGASTSGVVWRFFRLADSVLTLDNRDYLIADPAKILGILSGIVRRPPAA